MYFQILFNTLRNLRYDFEIISRKICRILTNFLNILDKVVIVLQTFLIKRHFKNFWEKFKKICIFCNQVIEARYNISFKLLPAD